MASMWRRAMLYLGLGPDDEYNDEGAYEDAPPAAAAPPSPAREPAGVTARPAAPARGRPAPRPSRAGVGQPGGEPEMSASVRTIATAPVLEPSTTSSMPVPSAGRPVVRALPPTARPHSVAPTSFNDAQEVADKFKSNVPVIMNLQGIDRDLARRLIDFCSGLCYGLGGHMEKVAHQVYLLTPQDVEVSAEDKRRLAERGLYDA